MQWLDRLFNRPPKPSKELIGISLPGKYSIPGRTALSDRVPVMIRLFMLGTVRSYETDPVGQRSHEIDFWVETGKFPKDDMSNNFEWILSPREQKKRILAELIKGDVDVKKDA